MRISVWRMADVKASLLKKKKKCKEIKGFPGYFISKTGIVYSTWKKGNKQYKAHPYDTWKELKSGSIKSKHKMVVLCKNGKKVNKLVHRLVLETFVGPCPKGLECRHYPDRNPSNNNVNNLSWGTRKQNQADRLIHKTDGRGERGGMAKLTEIQIIQIRKEYNHKIKNLNQPSLAKKYSVTQSLIHQIVRKKCWKHLEEVA